MRMEIATLDVHRPEDSRGRHGGTIEQWCWYCRLYQQASHGSFHRPRHPEGQPRPGITIRPRGVEEKIEILLIQTADGEKRILEIHTRKLSPIELTLSLLKQITRVDLFATELFYSLVFDHGVGIEGTDPLGWPATRRQRKRSKGTAPRADEPGFPAHRDPRGPGGQLEAGRQTANGRRGSSATFWRTKIIQAPPEGRAECPKFGF